MCVSGPTQCPQASDFEPRSFFFKLNEIVLDSYFLFCFFLKAVASRFCLFWLHWVFFAARGLFLFAVSRGCSLVAGHRLFIVVASLVAEHGP